MLIQALDEFFTIPYSSIKLLYAEYACRYEPYFILDYAYHINTCLPGFSDLPMALRLFVPEKAHLKLKKDTEARPN